MPRALAVAGLTADTDLGPRSAEAIVLGIVVLSHAGRVALGAHEVPVLVQLGPMQDIVVADLLMGIEVEPALAAVVLRTAVPGDRQRLGQPPGNAIRYCCSGSTPKVYFTSNVASFPSGPSVSTKNRPSLRKKRDGTP